MAPSQPVRPGLFRRNKAERIRACSLLRNHSEMCPFCCQMHRGMEDAAAGNVNRLEYFSLRRAEDGQFDGGSSLADEVEFIGAGRGT